MSGYFSINNCTMCRAGHYSSSTGMSFCTLCSAGTYFNYTGASLCALCTAGMYSALTGAVICIPCSNGSYSNEVGSTKCFDCPTGSFCGTGASSPTQCPIGSFSSLPGSSSCFWCPPGKFSGSAGTWDCPLCSAGSYSSAYGSSFCTLCPPGSYSEYESNIPLNCSECSPGSYAQDLVHPSWTMQIFNSPSASTTPEFFSQSDMLAESAEVPYISFQSYSWFQNYAPQIPPTYFAWRFYGVMQINIPGEYNICSKSDDGSVVYIEDKIVILNDGIHASRTVCTVLVLHNQIYNIMVTGFQAWGDATMILSYQGPDTENVLAFVPSVSSTFPGCLSCPAGTFRSIDVSHCTQCPTGTYSSGLFSGDDANCTQCAEGFFSDSGASSCKSCALGTFHSPAVEVGSLVTYDCTEDCADILGPSTQSPWNNYNFVDSSALWIWNVKGASVSAPVGVTVSFTKTFYVAECHPCMSDSVMIADLYVCVDDYVSVYLNGALVQETEQNWSNQCRAT